MPTTVIFPAMNRHLSIAMFALASALQAADGHDFFEAKVRPLLIERCYECHSHEQKIKAGLALDSRPGWEKGGDSGPAIVPGQPAESLLLQAVGYADKDLQMPPKEKLPEAEIAILREWIAMGAPDPRAAPPREKAAAPAGMSVEDGRQFWAFVPPQPQRVPKVKNARWPRGDIDRFVLAKLEEKKFAPSPDADPHTFLRRLTFDLTGLPPTPAEIDAFVAAARRDPDAAIAAAVDRLLASPAFGERWARHWFDLALYADHVSSTGLLPDYDAWRYRDYVIAAFNGDKPWDQFVREQIAGDLLPARDDRERRERIVATAFLTHGPIQAINQYKDQLRWDIVDMQVAKIGQVFMGQTLHCARCHDHKFDPVPQRDYYALAGILQNITVLNGFAGSSKVFSDVIRRVLPQLPEDDDMILKATEAFDRKTTALEAAAAEKKSAVAALEKQMDELKGADPKPGDFTTRMDALKAKLTAARAASNRAGAAVTSHVKGNAPKPPQIVAANEPASPTDARITIRGQASQLGEEVPRGFLQVASVKPPPPIPDGASGRLQLAEWLTDPSHPLVARVFVNRVWHHLFGAGIVKSVDYFGVRGERPTHPELLDWLALRFVREGWSVKRLVREIAVSRTYRLGSQPVPSTANAADQDPTNAFLWRANARRLEGEAFRDALLAISGRLDPARGGPAVLDYQFNSGAVANFSVVKGDGAPPPEIANRRSIYLPVVRRGAKWSEGLRLLDAPSSTDVTGARPVSTVPTQSLYLLNSPLVIEQARLAARRLLEGAVESDAQRVRDFYRLALGRPAREAEVTAALDFVNATSVTSRPEAWAQFCHAILVCNEFLFRL